MYCLKTSFEDFLKQELDKYPELNLKDIDLLKKQVEENKELPPVENKLIIMFLHSCYYDVNNAYKTIVSHYKYRKELPQVFANYDPMAKEIKQVFDTVAICVLSDHHAGKKERIIYTHFKNVDPRQYDYVQSTRYFFMMLEHLIITNGTFDGVIVVMDTEGMSWRHITKTPINVMTRLLGFVQEALPVRLKEVHILNAGSVATMIYNISKPFLKRQLIDMLTLYPVGSTEVFKNLPKDEMPREIGGNGKSYFEYSEQMYKQMLSDRDWFLSLD